MHGSSNKGVKMKVSHLPVIPNTLLTECLLPTSGTLNSACLEVLVFKMGTLQPEDTRMIPFDWEMRLSHGPFGLLMPLNQ